MADVAKAFEALSRSIKRISAYRHAPDRFADYLQPAFAELTSVLSRHGSVTVAIEPMAFLFDGEPVLHEPARETSLAFRLHRDGVRRLTFQPGLSFAELLAFARIALPDSLDGRELGREDAAIELWKADLTSIAHETAQVFELVRTDEARVQLEQIEGRVRSTLRSHGPALVVDEDAHAAMPPLLGAAERETLDPEGGVQRLRRAALLLVRIVERRLAGRDLDSLAESLGQLIDEMLRQGDGRALGATLERVALPAAAELQPKLSPRLGEQFRLVRLAAICTLDLDLLIFGLPVYLSFLRPEAGPALVGSLAFIEGKSVRDLFAAAAGARLAACRDAFAAGLHAGSPEVARSLLAALAAAPSGERGALAAVAIGHRDVSVAALAIKLLGLHDPRGAPGQLRPLLAHHLPEVRLAAATALGGLRGDEEATAALLDRMRSLEFGLVDRGEREVLFEMLGRQRSSAGFGYLSEKLTSPSRTPLLRARALEDQLHAIRGLAAEGTERTLRLLEFAAHPDQENPPVIVAAAKAAGNHVREQSTRSAGERS